MDWMDFLKVLYQIADSITEKPNKKKKSDLWIWFMDPRMDWVIFSPVLHIDIYCVKPLFELRGLQMFWLNNNFFIPYTFSIIEKEKDLN